MNSNKYFLSGGALLLDVRCNKKSGDIVPEPDVNIVDMSQVGVFLAYANLTVPQSIWTWVEGDLFLPEACFDDEHAELRNHLNVPEEIEFKTKVKIGFQ
ncbi:hypothetical protein [Candidatus Parabeggiatoa sp. HSG14]|uniref:hypothetical protein n=1 Tax=Candidatus Parabeggiatoa sp. HSG14 TaxID=3055593 RepID=UPI0025A788AB|nr:hypothetical protein [Thiotrichales bacterium HSG14]